MARNIQKLMDPENTINAIMAVYIGIINKEPSFAKPCIKKAIPAIAPEYSTIRLSVICIMCIQSMPILYMPGSLCRRSVRTWSAGGRALGRPGSLGLRVPDWAVCRRCAVQAGGGVTGLMGWGVTGSLGCSKIRKGVVGLIGSVLVDIFY